MDVNDTDLPPGLDLSIGVNIWNIMECPGCGVNDGALSYQKRSGERRTLRVIFHAELGVDVILRRSTAGERRENDTVRKGQSTDLERGEESRRIGGGSHLSLVESRVGADGMERIPVRLEAEAGLLWPDISSFPFLYSPGSKEKCTFNMTDW